MDLASNSNAEGAKIQLYQKNGADAQKWKLHPKADGKIYHIRVRHSGQYLDVDHAQTAAGTRVMQFYHNGELNQQIRLTAADATYFFMEPFHAPGMVMAKSGKNDRNLDLLRLEAKKTGAANQLFRFEEIEAGTTKGYAIICKDGNLALDVIDYTYTPSSDVILTAHAETRYYWSDGQIIGMKSGSHSIQFSYDERNQLVSMRLDDKNYYYLYNVQGDVIGLLDSTGSQVVSYQYNSWGKLLTTTDTTAEKAGNQNPFRYRGYCWDEETGLYYVGSRYYDPETCRFISPDTVDVLTVEQGNLNQHNLYAYCLNNPVNLLDEDGHLSMPNWAKVAIGAVTTVAAVGITIATGGLVLPVLAGVAASTLSGAVMGYVTGGKEGAINGAADGFMWGGIGAFASSAVSAIRAIKTARKGITIGEDMKKVRRAAAFNNTATYKSMRGYNLIKKIAGENVADKLSLYHNNVFIQRMRKLGAIIYDNGPVKQNVPTSIWYKMERNVLKGYKWYIRMY